MDWPYMDWLYLVSAALCFAAGGLFMKYSEGATRIGLSFVFMALFVLGAVAQARAMRRTDMAVVYVAVLGLEAVLALGLSTAVLHERLSWQRLGAVTLIVFGIALLERS
jgi:multidrug transporter EmrE-like cation transporter